MSRFGQGLAISTGLHAGVIALVIFVVAWNPIEKLPRSNPSFAHAIAITLAPPRVQPEPQPQPQVVPNTLKPVPALPAIPTQAVHSELNTPPPVEKPTPISTPSPQTEQQQVDYAQVVSAILEQHKRYPRQAMVAGEEGVVVLSFVINRQGTVLAYSIVSSSGEPSFENEVRRLIHNVQFPPFPSADLDQRKKFQVAIEFKLQG
ncbi:MAG: energy transducer TonB [Gammaproteobacteria bacterium]